MTQRAPDGAAIIRRVRNVIDHKAKPTLDDLEDAISHIDATKTEWRQTALLLACQVINLQDQSDVARMRDALSALRGIKREVEWFDEVESYRGAR